MTGECSQGYPKIIRSGIDEEGQHQKLPVPTTLPHFSTGSLNTSSMQPGQRSTISAFALATESYLYCLVIRGSNDARIYETCSVSLGQVGNLVPRHSAVPDLKEPEFGVKIPSRYLFGTEIAWIRWLSVNTYPIRLKFGGCVFPCQKMVLTNSQSCGAATAMGIDYLKVSAILVRHL